MSDAISLGDALKQFLSKSKMKYGIQSMQIKDLWEEIMGTTIAKYTDKIELRNETLFIHTSVAPLKNELVFLKEKIIERVNEKMGAHTVKEVVIV
ncbi:MAG: hypothetical protein RL131_1261 [Bacteroidota bacterium]|jgi:hypothetical protein